jgi:hypothetical protein
MRENMRNHGEIRSVARLQEKRHANDQSDHRGKVMGIHESDAEAQGAHHHAKEDEPEFFSHN